jgi:hypothetical protein
MASSRCPTGCARLQLELPAMVSLTEQIRSRERQWMTAILEHDAATLEAILAPGFVYTASDRGRRSRQEWLDDAATYHFTLLELLDADVEHYGAVAIVQARVRQQARLDGRRREGIFLITDVWVRRLGIWQVVTRASVEA